MNKWMSSLTEKQKKDILGLFYRKRFYYKETVIDNMDSTIAKQLGLKKSTVSHFIADHLTEKFNALNKKINGNNNKI
jgi:hypothetical protein